MIEVKKPTSRKGDDHTPHIESDNLRSGQTLSIIDAISEGEIFGLATGDMRSVYINKTQVVGEDGQINVSGVDFELRSGTQNQAPLFGVPNVEREIPVDVDITKKGGGHTVTVTDVNVERARVTVGVRSLAEGNDKGDRFKRSVSMQILLNGTVVHNVNINGKTMSEYLRSYIVDLPSSRPATIKVIRTSNDTNSDYIQDETFFSSYTEIIDSKLRYPNTAIVGISLDSETFNGQPTRNYLIKGLVINVPKNYDPIKRTYSGFWDGSFKKAWTDNPAWILYDLLTNNRYGIGERLGASRVDKIKLYEIAQYCDQLVPTGYEDGSMEPRMTMNCNITEQRDAYDVINDICSIFRGMPVWDGMSLGASLDTPSDPQCQYTNSNVVEGKFNYKSSALKARHTAVEIEYVHSADGTYSKRTEFVQDDEAVSRIGYNLKKIQAFGCTSRGQAVRAGRFILETERLERQTVTFDTGREGLRHNVGDIIEIADNSYSGVKLGGRIKAISADKKTVTLDRDVDAKSGGTFSLLDVSGDIKRVAILGNPSADSLYFQYPLETAKVGMVWTIAATSKIKPRPFRCLAISENDDGSFTVEALEHEPLKNESIDSGYRFEPDPDTAFGGKLPAIIDLSVDASSENLAEEGWQLLATWRTPTMFSNVMFRCEIFNDAGALVSRTDVNEMMLKHPMIAIGEYTLAVQARTDIGQLGEKSIISFAIDKPKKPQSVLISSDEQAITLRVAIPSNTVGTQAECYYSSNKDHMKDPENLAERFDALGNLFVDWVGYPSTANGYSSRYYAIRSKNALGVSDWYFTGEVRTKTFDQGIGNLIGQQFPDFDWINELKGMKNRAYLGVETKGGVKGGVFVDGATGDNIAINFVADQVGFTNPDNYNDPLLYFDTVNKLLTLKGKLILGDGKIINSTADIRAEDGKDGVSEMFFTGFEDGDAIFVETGTHVELVTNDVWSGTRASFIPSYFQNIHIKIPQNLVSKFLGERIEISFYAKKADSNTDETHTIQALWNADRNSPWVQHTLTGEWQKFTQVVEVTPGTTSSAGLAFDSSVSATNKGWLIDNISVYLKSKDGEKGQTGQTGAQGQPGDNGAGFYRKQVSAISWTNPTVLNAFISASGRKPVPDDVFTQFLANGTAQTRRYVSDVSLWQEASLLVHGDMIATGTISGDRITAGTEISAPSVKGGSVQGAYFAGGTAGFGEVSSGGYLLGSNNKRYNTIIQADGTIKTNRIQADDGKFSGTVQASQVIGAKVLIKSGSAKINDMGKIYTDDGIRVRFSTGHPSTAWGDSKSTYVIECTLSGSIQADPSLVSSVRFGALGLGACVMTPWTGTAYIWGVVQILLLNCTSTSSSTLNWKLYQIL